MSHTFNFDFSFFHNKGAPAAVSASFSKYSSLAGSAAVHAVVAATPLVSGHALGVVFLGKISQ